MKNESFFSYKFIVAFSFSQRCVCVYFTMAMTRRRCQIEIMFHDAMFLTRRKKFNAWSLVERLTDDRTFRLADMIR